MADETWPRPLLRSLTLIVLATLACAAVVTLGYQRVVSRCEASRLGISLLETLVLANRNVEVTRLRFDAGLIEARHAPTGRELLFSFRDLAGGRTAVGLEDYPMESEPGWRAAAWVPVYSGAHVESFRHHADNGNELGELRLLSSTPLSALVVYYEDALRREGMELVKANKPDGSWTAQARTRDRLAQVAVRLVPRERGTQVVIEYAGR